MPRDATAIRAMPSRMPSEGGQTKKKGEKSALWLGEGACLWPSGRSHSRRALPQPPRRRFRPYLPSLSGTLCWLQCFLIP